MRRAEDAAAGVAGGAAGSDGGVSATSAAGLAGARRSYNGEEQVSDMDLYAFELAPGATNGGKAAAPKAAGRKRGAGKGRQRPDRCLSSENAAIK